MKRVVLRHRAEADLEDARTWYALEDEQLGIAFVEEVRHTIQWVRQLPLLFPTSAATFATCPRRTTALTAPTMTHNFPGSLREPSGQTEPLPGIAGGGRHPSMRR